MLEREGESMCMRKRRKKIQARKRKDGEKQEGVMVRKQGHAVRQGFSACDKKRQRQDTSGQRATHLDCGSGIKFAICILL